MVGESGQPRAEHVATSVRELQPFDVQFRDNRAPHAASPARVGAGTIFTRKKILTDRGENAAPYRVEIEYETGHTVIFEVQFGNPKWNPSRTELGVSAERPCGLRAMKPRLASVGLDVVTQTSDAHPSVAGSDRQTRSPYRSTIASLH